MQSLKLICGLMLLDCLAGCLLGCTSPQAVEEITFRSGPFKVVGDLKLPSGTGPHPVVVFVHGDGPNNRTSSGTYPPIMSRMHRAGYATFAWDKPGTGESTGEFDRRILFEQRARVLLDAIAVLKNHPALDPDRIGLWGVSQAGYVMPVALAQSEDIAFMIAVSCPGEAGIDQTAYLVGAQARCEGLSPKDATHIEQCVAAVEWAKTYDEYVKHKKVLERYPILAEMGLNMGIRAEENWERNNFDGEYFFDPMPVIESATIPILAFFGEKDTQVDPYQGMKAYQAALERAGHELSQVVLISGVDHNLIISEAGSLKERDRRTARGWQNYPAEYLDLVETWLTEIKGQ